MILSVPFPEVQNRKGTESGLNIHNAFTNIVTSFSKSLWCSQLVYVAYVIVVIAKKGGKNCRRGQVALLQCKNKKGILILKGIGFPYVQCTMFFCSSIFLLHGTKKLFLAIPLISDAAIKVICRPL